MIKALRSAAFLFSLALLVPSAPAEAATCPNSGLRMSSVAFETAKGRFTSKLEVAATAEEQACGMMFRDRMPPGTGMAFPMQPPRATGFWMENTPLPLDTRSADWSRFSHDVCGAKLHVIYDPQGDRPIYAALTPARVNDVTVAQQMPIEPGATYVFDLGYYDYAWWASLDAKGCRLVTRFKTNTPLELIRELEVPAGGDILSDRIGLLPRRQTKNRRNPMGGPVREVRVRIEGKRELRLLSNDLDASAQEIADLYKRRWRIELFFRWLKQNLRIRKFVGTSENAVRLQIAAALIAFLLLRLAQATQTRVTSPLAFVRLVRDNLMRRRSIADLLPADDPPPSQSPQLTLKWC